MINTTYCGQLFRGYKRLWPFSSKEAFEDLEKRVRRLEEDFKRLELDAEDLHERAKRMFGRVVKERARIDQAAASANGDGGDAEPLVPPSPHQSTTLSAHQKEVQQQILKRRMGAL